MADHTELGRFVWHELRTSDPVGAQAFYGAALGWRIESALHGRAYSMFAAHDTVLGRFTAGPPEATPEWIPIVSVPDVNVILRRAIALGAVQTIKPGSLQNGARYAGFEDPHGATIGIYSTSRFLPEKDALIGEFSWHELATTAPRAAFAFYQELFEWEHIAEHDRGPLGRYLLFGRNGRQLGGIFDKGEHGRDDRAYWLSYIRVGNVQRVLKRIKAGRGKVLLRPTETPGGDRIAQFTDPYGARFAIHQLAEERVSLEGGADDAGAARSATGAGARVTKTVKKKRLKKKPSKKKAAKKAAKTPAKPRG